ncbi:MAG: sugar phosphate isomerase/epimerase [Kiritimatiellae bacterium]|nr:sugar phosphate isomerase/epimerase [Kiritimatiellia bacterium]MDW8457895.1 TIM barrel protein [Verrucomicrobiota bacterium]
MEFALSTHWNAARHGRGETMIEEIVRLGFRRVELGYDLRHEQVPGVMAMVRDGAIRVDSVHNFCPVPFGAPRGHPELWSLASRDERERDTAVRNTMATIRFAAEVGARVVVTHAGHVDMPPMSPDLFELAVENRQDTPEYERRKIKLMEQREKRAPAQFELLLRSLERLVPTLDEVGVTLALENLPNWEAFPTELEFEAIKRRLPTPRIAYWHDIGHGQIRQNLGFTNHYRWLERLWPHTAGMHVHDLIPPATDHVMPPRGSIDFARFSRFAEPDKIYVIEPSSRAPFEEVAAGLAHLRQVWGARGDSTQKPREKA